MTATRPNSNVDFFLYQTSDTDLLLQQTLQRNAVLQAVGFISTSIVVSEDKLTMKIISLWESENDRLQCNTKYHKAFSDLLNRYNTKNNVVVEYASNFLPDTQQLKAKKFSSRLTIEQASAELKEFITRQKSP